MRPTRLVSFALLSIAVLVFSGCYGISSQSVSQRDTIGDVQIDTTICSDRSGVPGGPPSTCPSNALNGTTAPSNVLIAYRVPAGFSGPDSFQGQETGGPPGGPTITFTKDPTYTAALTAKATPASGEQWIGYRSDTSVAFDLPVSVRFSLPSTHPFRGPFDYRTVTGWIDDQSTGQNDPVECADDPTTPSAANGNGTRSVCIDFPAAGTWQTDDTPFATRDLGIDPGADTTVQQNSDGTVPFAVNFAGAADPSATFDISASSNAPGVTVSPSTNTLTPGTDSTTPITVVAHVPATTSLGTYDVTLTAKNSEGQQRSATGKLIVALGKPVNLALPFIGGTDAVGKTVSCSSGDWSSNPTTYAYQWVRGGTDISGATSSNYTLTQTDGARLVACQVTATNAAGDGSATSGPIRVAQEGGADVDLHGRTAVTSNSNGSYTVDTGITVSCPPRLPANCGGADRLTTDSATRSRASRAAVLEVAHGGFAAKSGAKRRIVVKLSRAGSKLLRRARRLTLIATIVTRNHALQPVTSRKRFTVTAPR